MQTRDEVKGLHNCQEFLPQVFISGYANTGKKFSIAFIKYTVTSSKNCNAGKDTDSFY